MSTRPSTAFMRQYRSNRPWADEWSWAGVLMAIGVVESFNSLGIKALRLSAAKKGGRSSSRSIWALPVPAFGRGERPIAFRNPSCERTRRPSSRTTHGNSRVPMRIVPGSVPGTPKTVDGQCRRLRRRP